MGFDLIAPSSDRTIDVIDSVSEEHYFSVPMRALANERRKRGDDVAPS